MLKINWFLYFFVIEQTIQPLSPDDPVLNGHLAELMYENAVKKIPVVSFVVELLKLSQDYDFTKKLQNKIVK